MANTTGTLTQAQLDAVNNGLGSIGTEGDLFYRDATGLQKLAKGTSGQTLKMGGSNAPEWVTVDAPASTWTKIGTAVASTSASLTVTGLDTSVYQAFAIRITNITNNDNGHPIYIRLGDSSGIDSGSSDYEWTNVKHDSGHTHVSDVFIAGSAAASNITIDTHVGKTTGMGMSAMVHLSCASTAIYPTVTFESIAYDNSGHADSVRGGGVRLSAINVTQVTILSAYDNLLTGRMTVYGISHA